LQILCKPAQVYMFICSRSADFLYIGLAFTQDCLTVCDAQLAAVNRVADSACLLSGGGGSVTGSGLQASARKQRFSVFFLATSACIYADAHVCLRLSDYIYC